MLRINQSAVTSDEDAAVDMYDEAILAFKKAAALSPGKLIELSPVQIILNQDNFYRKPQTC